MKTILMYFYILVICFLCFDAAYSITYGLCIENGVLILIGAFLYGLAYFLSKLILEVFDNEIIKLKEQIKKIANKYGTEEES